MMRTMIAGATVSAIAFVAMPASADFHDPSLDETYELGGFNLNSEANGGVISASFTIVPPANDFPIVGFSFSGTVAGITGSGSWASDLQLAIDDPNGNTTLIGGFSTPSDFDWDFQGSGSADDGDYASGPHFLWEDSPIDKDGVNAFVFTFTNDWNSELAAMHQWSNIEITFHKIPAPGALALLGLAGLVGSRRRRN